jgi:hypothetical protein
LKQRIYFDGCLRKAPEVGQAECAMGDTASPTTVALIGDSNAAMWTPGFQRVAAHRHWRLEMLAKAACPMLDLPLINDIAHRAYTECDQWRAQIAARLQTEHPQLIVYSVRRTYLQTYDAVWLDTMTRLVQQLRGTGAKVLVLGGRSPIWKISICKYCHWTACGSLG